MGKLNTVPPNPFPPSSENVGGGALPVASAETLGGVKVGSNLSIDESGTLSAPAPYSLPAATDETLGGVKVGSGLSIDAGGVLSADSQKVDYSTNEVDTGVKWIDGKAIYLKVIDTPIAIAQNDTWYNSGLAGVDTVINYSAKMTRDGEQIGDTFNGGTLDYVVRNNDLLVKGTSITITDTYIITTQIVYYTKVTT